MTLGFGRPNYPLRAAARSETAAPLQGGHIPVHTSPGAAGPAQGRGAGPSPGPLKQPLPSSGTHRQLQVTAEQNRDFQEEQHRFSN